MSKRCESDVRFYRAGRWRVGQCLNNTKDPSGLCWRHNGKHIEPTANRWGMTIEEREADVLEALRDMGWVKPIDIGGQNCSHHSTTLTRLVKQGLVERKVWGGYTRPSYQYRLAS